MTNVLLGVNIDHVATLRQVRAGLTPYPDVVEAAREAKLGGADQVTIHLRGDRRHIQDRDLFSLSEEKILPINLELAVEEDILKIALKAKPAICCFVPEKRKEVTTEGGLDVVKKERLLKVATAKLLKKSILSSYFIEGSVKQVQASHRAGAWAIEFHTGQWVLEKNAVKKQKLFDRLQEAAAEAHRLGIKVHAGHGLSYEHIADIRKLLHLRELNIGHSLVSRALFVGLRQAVRDMKNLLE